MTTEKKAGASPSPPLSAFERRIAVDKQVVEMMLRGQRIKATDQPVCKACYHKIDYMRYGSYWFHTNIHDDSHKVEPLVLQP